MNAKKIMLTLLSALCVYSYADNQVNQDITSISLSDQMVTIKPSTHTEAENEVHQSYCADLGAIDVTDKSTIKVGSGVTDPMNSVVMCQKNITKEEFEMSQEANTTSTWQGGLDDNPNIKKHLNNLASSICSVTAYPINGTFTTPKPIPGLVIPNSYTATATYQYTLPASSNTMVTDNTQVPIRTENGPNCNASAQSNIRPDGNGYGQSYVTMQCPESFFGYKDSDSFQTWNNVVISGQASCSQNSPGIIRIHVQ